MTTGDKIKEFYLDYDDTPMEDILKDVIGLRSDIPEITIVEFYESSPGNNYHVHFFLNERVMFGRVFLACCSTRCCPHFLNLIKDNEAFGIRVSSVKGLHEKPKPKLVDRRAYDGEPVETVGRACRLDRCDG